MLKKIIGACSNKKAQATAGVTIGSGVMALIFFLHTNVTAKINTSIAIEKSDRIREADKLEKRFLEGQEKIYKRIETLDNRVFEALTTKEP